MADGKLRLVRLVYLMAHQGPERLGVSKYDHYVHLH